MKVFVTGGAGFIGSNLVGTLLELGHEVTAHDNLHLGRRRFLEPFLQRETFTFVQDDLLDLDALARCMAGSDLVFHMAANSDIGYGARNTDTDLRMGTLATYNVLEAMRRNGVGRIVFASTSAVYGEATRLPTPEDYGPLFPISLYGASKLAGEGLITAFCHNFRMQAWIFRFGNVVGRNGTHGALVDFIRRLRADPARLPILGDGRQAKPYLHVAECVDGMLFGLEHAGGQVNAFNLACEGATPVTRIAEMITERMGLKYVSFEYTGGSRGWTGDVPQVRLDPSRMLALGWRTRLSSDEAVERAIGELLEQY